eukprot:6188611-Pleurochrysis_carterae.AAC.1
MDTTIHIEGCVGCVAGRSAATDATGVSCCRLGAGAAASSIASCSWMESSSAVTGASESAMCASWTRGVSLFSRPAWMLRASVVSNLDCSYRSYAWAD